MNLANLANQLDVAAIDTGLGQRFYLQVLKSATPEQLEKLADTLINDSQLKGMVIESMRTLALERETKAA